MKAVNLLPSDAQRSFSTLRGLNVGTSGLLGALAVAVIAVAGYVALANNVTSKRQELARTQSLQTAAERQVAELKPYADLESLRQSLLDRVKTLAGSRFDWPGAIDRVVRAFPADANLTDFEGAAATEGAAPTVTLAGCTPSHDAVAGLIDRLRAVKGVDGVTLASSTVAGGKADKSCPHAEQFRLTVQMKAPAGAAAAATAAAATAATPGQTPATTPAQTPTTTTPAAPATGGKP